MLFDKVVTPKGAEMCPRLDQRPLHLDVISIQLFLSSPCVNTNAHSKIVVLPKEYRVLDESCLPCL